MYVVAHNNIIVNSGTGCALVGVSRQICSCIIICIYVVLNLIVDSNTLLVSSAIHVPARCSTGPYFNVDPIDPPI